MTAVTVPSSNIFPTWNHTLAVVHRGTALQRVYDIHHSVTVERGRWGFERGWWRMSLATWLLLRESLTRTYFEVTPARPSRLLLGCPVQLAADLPHNEGLLAFVVPSQAGSIHVR